MTRPDDWPSLDDRAAWRACVVVALTTAVVLAVAACGQHAALRTRMTDVGIILQALNAALEGDLWLTHSASDGQRPLLATHSSFIVYLLAPLFALTGRSAYVVVSLPAFAVAFAATGVFAWARELGVRATDALALACALLVCPVTHDAVLYDFQVGPIVVACTTWGLWALHRRRRAVALGLLLLAMLCKEDAPLAVLALVWAFRRRLSGIAPVVAAGIVISVVDAALLVTLNADRPTREVEARYAWMFAPEPWRHLGAWTTWRLPLYFAALGGALLARAPSLLVPVVAPLALPLLAQADGWTTRVTGVYYAFPAYAALLMCCASVGDERKTRGASTRVLAAALVASVLFSPLPYAVFAERAHYDVPVDVDDVRRALALVPPDAVVCAQSNLAAQLALRRVVQRAPKYCDDADYIVFFLRAIGGPDTGLNPRSSPFHLLPRDAIAGARRFAVDPDYGAIEAANGVYVFARGRSPSLTAASVLNAIARDERRLLDRWRRDAEARSVLLDALNGPGHARFDGLRNAPVVVDGP